MTQVLIRGTVLGLLAGGMAACATSPAYPIAAGETPPPAAQSSYQTPPQTSSPTGAPESQPSPPPSTPVAPPADVTSQSLAPASTAIPPPAPAPEPRPAQPPTPTMKPKYAATGKVIPAKKMFRDYKVQKGDHLDEIARDLETTRATLAAANRLKSPFALTPGQHLRLPVEKAYEVQPGDTLAAVARRFDMTEADLADLNGMSVRERLRPGDLLALPPIIHDRGPVLVQDLRAPGVRPLGPSSLPRPIPAEPETSPTLTDAQITAAGRGRFLWPVRGEVISAFGVKDLDRRNDGVDIKAPLGAPVHAAASGDVVYAGDQVPGFGNLVLIKHADGWVTAYAYLARITVKMRQSVAQDEQIGEVGQSGGVTEPQLHFEIRYAPTPAQRAKPIDPQLVLPGR